MELNEEFRWQGRTISCGRAGSGPDVVFCHGTPFSSRVWSRYADALAMDHTVHVWDMPGYGRSSKHAEHAVDFDAQGKAFAALLEHWQLDRPHVIAHDFGGSAALRATLFEGATFASLLMTDVVAIPPAGSPFFRFVQQHSTVLDDLPGYVHRAVLHAYITAASHRGLREDELAELVEPWTTKIGQPAFYRQIAAYDENLLVENEHHLGELRLPVQVLWGADDSWIPIETGRRIAGLIPGAAFREVPGAGHLIQYDTPVALATIVRAWLDGQTSVTPATQP